MERIQAAIQKAKEQRGSVVAPSAGGGLGGGISRGAQRPPQVGPAWTELASFDPEPRLLARNHIVTFEDVDPAHSHFDILRTKVLRAMQRNGWTSLGVTSPTSGCGKTTLALNLAFSLAHQPDVILIDMPPMLVSDSLMALAPHLDCVLLVAAAENTRLDEVDKCEHDLAEQTNVLGVVLNKCRYMGEDYGYY